VVCVVEVVEALSVPHAVDRWCHVDCVETVESRASRWTFTQSLMQSRMYFETKTVGDFQCQIVDSQLRMENDDIAKSKSLPI